MDNSCDKNLLLISNHIENPNKIKKIFNECNNFFEIKYENLVDFISNTKLKLNRRNTLIIMLKDFFSEKIYNDIDQCFKKYFNFEKPFFLLLFFNELTEEEEKYYDENDIFYYYIGTQHYLNSRIFYKNFKEFIELIFNKIIINDRIDDYIVKSFKIIYDSYIISKQKKEIEKLYYELELLSMTDPLTKLLNRRAFYEALENERKRLMRSLTKFNKIKMKMDEEATIQFLETIGIFSCLMIDIDYFKNVNDNYGHLIGDMVLKKVGKLINSKTIFRDNDIKARFGGEEFIIILTNTCSKNAFIPAERLREKIKAIDFFDSNNNKFNITISIGISQYNENDKTLDDVINRADKALYIAKKNGRDQTVIYENIFAVSS